MDLCSSYEERIEKRLKTDGEIAYERAMRSFLGQKLPYREDCIKRTIVGICLGTQEKDACDCEGDRTKCSFYREVREKALKEQSEGSHERNG